MTTYDFTISDLEKFAEHMGFDGLDTDVFYESYYNMTDESDDYEAQWDESMELHWWWKYYLSVFPIDSAKNLIEVTFRSITY